LKTTSNKEITIVEGRINSLGYQFETSFVAGLLRKMPRLNQHGLFWLMLDINKYQTIKQSLGVISNYENGKYLNKAINKLKSYNDSVQYNANVAEMVIVAYYMNLYPKKGNIIWERKIPNTQKSVDITLYVYPKPINIEVTGISDSYQIRGFHIDRYTIKDQLEPLIIDNYNPKYSYLITFDDVRLNSETSNLDINKLALFINKSKLNGVGNYSYNIENEPRAKLKISLLNKRKKEYIADMTIYSGLVRDSLRIQSKVIEKAKNQLISLPDNEINFIIVPNFAMLDNEDYIEAMYGLCVVRVNPNDHNDFEYGYADDGVSAITEKDGYAKIHAIIKSSFNYFDNHEKFAVINSRRKPPDDVLDVILSDVKVSSVF
jgi:hypothetical protein